jgi:hypothetical protein
MLLRRALLPVALVLTLGLVSADLAQAAPVSAPLPSPGVAFGGVHVGFGVGVVVPLGPRHRHARPVRRVAPSGYWAVQRERVWVPGELIGYDRFGRPVVTEGFWTVESRRVWVRAEPYVQRHVVRPAPRGRIAVGLSFH